MSAVCKAFHFDLDVEKLKKYYPSDSPFGYKQAWSDIKKFMEAHGFQHSQYSGYESTLSLTTFAAFKSLKKCKKNTLGLLSVLK